MMRFPREQADPAEEDASHYLPQRALFGPRDDEPEHGRRDHNPAGESERSVVDAVADARTENHRQRTHAGHEPGDRRHHQHPPERVHTDHPRYADKKV